MIGLLALILAAPPGQPAAPQPNQPHPAVAEARAILSVESGDPRALGPAILKEGRWPDRANWALARRAFQRDAPCPERLAITDGLKPNGPDRDAETRLRWLLSAQIACKADPKETARRLAIDFPTAEDDVSMLSPDERRARARSLEETGDYTAARDIWTALGTREDRFEVARLGLKRFRTDFKATAALFKALVQGDDDLSAEAAYLHAKSLGREGDLKAAMAAYDAVGARFPAHKVAEDAAFFKAFSMYERARLPKAASERQAAYRAAAKAFDAMDAKSWADSAAWYAAWCRFLAGDRVAPEFDAIANGAKAGSQSQRKARFWAAHADLPWKPAAAAARFSALLADQTHDWYSLLIIREFPALAPKPAALTDPPAIVPSQLAAGVDEIRALVAADLMWFARSRFTALRPALREAKATGLEARLAVEVGDAEDTLRHATARNQAILVHPIQPADLPIWRAAYPAAYAEPIAKASKANAIPPALIHGFIRKESAYAPDAVSAAHAKGLMQLIPRTARSIRAARGLGLGDVDLHDPKTNIEFGAWYVGALAKRYGGQLPIVMATFNAGPGAYDTWKGAETQVPTALWVEMIPFLQAREYVKRLTATLVIYDQLTRPIGLAQAVDAAIPAQVDAAIDTGGVDY